MKEEELEFISVQPEDDESQALNLKQYNPSSDTEIAGYWLFKQSKVSIFMISFFKSQVITASKVIFFKYIQLKIAPLRGILSFIVPNMTFSTFPSYLLTIL